MKQDNKDALIGYLLIVLYVVAVIALVEFLEWWQFRDAPTWDHVPHWTK